METSTEDNGNAEDPIVFSASQKNPMSASNQNSLDEKSFGSREVLETTEILEDKQVPSSELNDETAPTNSEDFDGPPAKKQKFNKETGTPSSHSEEITTIHKVITSTSHFQEEGGNVISDISLIENDNLNATKHRAEDNHGKINLQECNLMVGTNDEEVEEKEQSHISKIHERTIPKSEQESLLGDIDQPDNSTTRNLVSGIMKGQVQSEEAISTETKQANKEEMVAGIELDNANNKSAIDTRGNVQTVEAHKAKEQLTEDNHVLERKKDSDLQEGIQLKTSTCEEIAKAQDDIQATTTDQPSSGALHDEGTPEFMIMPATDLLMNTSSQSASGDELLHQISAKTIDLKNQTEMDQELHLPKESEGLKSYDAATVSYDEGTTDASTRSESVPLTCSASKPIDVETTIAPTNDNDLPLKKKESKHTRTKHVAPKVLEIRRRIQLGCRDNDLESAMGAYDEAIRDNVRVEAQSFYNLLNLCDGLERAVHVGTPKGSSADTSNSIAVGVSLIDSKKRQEYAFRLKDHMTELNIPLNEAAYTAIVKVLARNKEYVMAETILEESETIQQCKPRLRLYTPLLLAYCEERLMLDALKCWLRITNKELELTEREFLALMKCAIATGDIQVFGCVLREIADSIAVPSKETAGAILEWFESPHAIFHNEAIRIPKHADNVEVKALLDEIFKNEIERPPSMDPVQTTKGWDKSSAVSIDSKTGVLKEGCLQNCSLKPVPLSQRAWDEMMAMNEKIVLEGQLEENKSQFQGGRKGKMRIDFDTNERKLRWNHFTSFLESIGHIDVVIDSANVGYFKQNFSNAPKHVDYDQIDWVARRFLAMGKKVLLILHSRHFHPKLMPGKYKPLQYEWERMRILYKTPGGMNDDWFWLHAALKYRTLVLTNDEMRDHHFQMLAPRIFLRWKERHQVHFNFGDWGEPIQGGRNLSRRARTVELEFPAVYSRRVQRVDNGLVVPLIKRGDENRFLDGAHVANNDEPIEETYLCIQAMK